MKVLSIKEPWATKIRNGEKTIETRTWNTKHRGIILLHASKNPKSEISGKIFAVARILDCKPMVKDDEKFACCEIYPKAHSWFLGDVHALPEPVEAKGNLGLWDLNNQKVRLELFEETLRIRNKESKANE